MPAGRVWGQLGLLSWQGFQTPHVARIAARCVLETWGGLTQVVQKSSPPCMNLALPTVK